MKQTSKTGLTSSPTKTINRFSQNKTVHLRPFAKPAPYILKPYFGLYNPYPDGCSLLCNHPMEKEAKELFLKARENWMKDEKKNTFLTKEIEAMKTNVSQFNFVERTLMSQAEMCVPEELFRRYTETDSRPLTPEPALVTRSSGSRRCLTPEPDIGRSKAQLVLDLRRTHSQETISYSASLQGSSMLRLQVPTKAASLEALSKKSASSPAQVPTRKIRTVSPNTKLNLPVFTNVDKNRNVDNESENVDYMKRRGKRKKKKERDGSGGVPTLQMDPETQVATETDQSPKIEHTPQDKLDINLTPFPKKSAKSPRKSVINVDSYLNMNILRYFRRELDQDSVDCELNLKRRKALEEALKIACKDKCPELSELQKQLNIPSLNVEFWINLPRSFTRSSSRFELPMNSDSLSTLSPMEYLKEHVSISSERKLLFNCIFEKFKLDLEIDQQRQMSCQSLQEALDLLMGRPMKLSEQNYFKNLTGWKEEDKIDFKIFCGISALCERVMAPFYCCRLPDRKRDPCHEIEKADFELLTRKIKGQNIDERLLSILTIIKTA